MEATVGVAAKSPRASSCELFMTTRASQATTSTSKKATSSESCSREKTDGQKAH